MLTVQRIHNVLKGAALQCALRFPEAAGYEPGTKIPGYRITRKQFGWEILMLDADGSKVKVDRAIVQAFGTAGITAAVQGSAIRIPVK